MILVGFFQHRIFYDIDRIIVVREKEIDVLLFGATSIRNHKMIF